LSYDSLRVDVKVMLRRMPLIPNSKEWLETLAKIDPVQAAMSRAAIASAGREDVCSVCGDTPAHDYQTHTSLLLRLCDDCLAMRTGSGEKLDPVDA
jgi:hypothetical protein